MLRDVASKVINCVFHGTYKQNIMVPFHLLGIHFSLVGWLLQHFHDLNSTILFVRYSSVCKVGSAQSDRSIPAQDSDTLRFVQQCLGDMGLKPGSIRFLFLPGGQWIQNDGYFISLMDPAWVSQILRTSTVDTWKHLAL